MKVHLKMKNHLIIHGLEFFWIFLFISILCINPSFAQRQNSSNMVKVENYFTLPLKAVGLTDYPPFSRYVVVKQNSIQNEIYMKVPFLSR